MSEETVDDKRPMRRADFRAGVVFALIAVAMLAEASTYPLADSYGGVQNAWYVSPALMPLLVGGSLLLLSLVLTANALAYGRAHGGAVQLLLERGQSSPTERMRLGAIVVLFVAFVYALIPSVDFVLATLLFLFTFISTFYVEEQRLVVLNTILFGGSSLLLYGLSETEVLEPYLYHPTDIVVFALTALIVGVNFRAVRASKVMRGKVLRAGVISLVVTLVICGAFKFGLLVPLPREGAVVRFMEDIVFELRH